MAGPPKTNVRLLVAAGAASALAGVNIATIQVALPTIARHFDASPGAASWTLLSYLVVFTVMVLILGRISDVWGHGRMYLTGLGTLTVASLLCGFAPTIEVLIALRCLQALGAAAMMCNIVALVAAAVPRERLAAAIGVNFTLGSLCQVLGPGVGGLLASSLGWRSVFWFNVPLGVLSLLLAVGAVPSSPKPQQQQRFDWIGALLVSCLLGGLVIGVTEGGLLGWTHPLASVSMIIFAMTTPLFIVSQHRCAHPLLDLRLFRHPVRGPAYGSVFFLGMSYYAVVALMSLYLQAARGLSAAETGLQVLALALAMTAATPISGMLGARFPARVVATTGAALVTIGLVGLTFSLTTQIWLPVCMGVVGAGVGLFMAPNTDDILGSVTPDSRALANGARQCIQNVGYTLSTAVFLAIVAAPLDDVERRAAYSGTLSDVADSSAEIFTAAFRVALLVAAGLGLAATLVSLMRPRRTDEPSATSGAGEKADAVSP
ncbi:MFS transporter [Mycobacterium sp. GA-2829]|uniref:MFS transporter n=1 Tax=Mycobacterium sp. GA-2829 TaxID=1772283 RepID=UPI0018D2520E|nr:MFS transporter [Mycobacterium sp. GA-2829]